MSSFFSRFFSKKPEIKPIPPRLASVTELESPSFRAFIDEINAFSRDHGLREFTNWSKVWEYPWLYAHGLDQIVWPGKRLIDFGSEISPMPWFLAKRGAIVTLIETDPQWLPIWEELRTKLGVNVSWKIVSDEILPLPDAFADAATSFSVIEHQPNKKRAVGEIARVLKPGAPLFISFDICEPSLGMTFPEWNGRALTMAEFEKEIWRHPAFVSDPAQPLTWNTNAMAAFRDWHLQSAPHHNYVVAAAVLRKKSQ
ncbi:MAG TPA: class I SAM-dependent methyltransferase [Opitutaceae bacterium]|nr:class I SAM-dependent methyltransferase [Opitutaceae bacterium]